MAPEDKTLPSIFDMEGLNTRFWNQKASEQAYRVSEERIKALELPPIREMGTGPMAVDFGSAEYPTLPPIGFIKEYNTAVDLAERNRGADFGYPKFLCTEALKERAKAAKFVFVSYENLPSSSFQAGNSLIESLRESNGTSAVAPQLAPDESYKMRISFICSDQEPITAQARGSSTQKCKLSDTAFKKELSAARQRKYYAANRELEAARQSNYHAQHKCPHGRRKHQCAECDGRAICPNCKTLAFASTLARRGMPKYDGHCATCFKHLWPDDPRSKHMKHEHTKELAVRQAINLEFEGFAHDKCLETSHCDCTMRRRIDCRKLINGTLLGVECDENAHLRYDQDDEKARYHDIFMGHGGKMVFIRFNPDLKGIPLEHKLSVLIEEIYKQIARIERCENSELLEVVYLFYPE
jgi:hypothetical protein